VTVDQTSQKQGEVLQGEEVPRVAYFFAGPIAKFAELRADHLYNQMKTYRRSVAVIEDLWVDLFRASGGSTHDWIVHHTGPVPKFSMPMQAGTFGPKEWLANGTGRVLAAGTDNAWDARWPVADVTSRLTMMAGPATEVFALETYPVDNAVVTPKDPPCQSLVVRRHNDGPFLAVWDAWPESPNLQSVSAGSGESSVRLKTSFNTYYLLFGPGEARFEDGASVRSDAAFAACRNRDAAMFVGGTTLEVTCPQGRLRLVADKPATVSVECSQGVATIEIAGDIHYDTVGGSDRYRPGPPVNVAIEGDLWQIDKRQHRFAGQIK
jgi:hypothetical protein